MKKIATSLALILGTFLPLLANAQCYLNDKKIPCGDLWAKTWWIWIVVFGTFGLFFAFWVWMLVHMIKNSIPNKVMWIILMIIPTINGIIPFIYYLIVKRKFDRGEFQPQPVMPDLNFSQPAPRDRSSDQNNGFCSNCGAPITPEMIFCGKCGNKLK